MRLSHPPSQQPPKLLPHNPSPGMRHPPPPPNTHRQTRTVSRYELRLHARSIFYPTCLRTRKHLAVVKVIGNIGHYAKWASRCTTDNLTHLACPSKRLRPTNPMVETELCAPLMPHLPPPHPPTHPRVASTSTPTPLPPPHTSGRTHIFLGTQHRLPIPWTDCADIYSLNGFASTQPGLASH
jgi:hypothetical protein